MNKIVVSAKQHHEALIKYKGVLRNVGGDLHYISEINGNYIEYKSNPGWVGSTTDEVNTVL